MLEHLDALVAGGVVTGYTVEEDVDYLLAQAPMLTYRMYADGPESQLNLGEFVTAMADLGASQLRVSRVRGAVGEGTSIRRTRQLCVTAELDGEAALELALDTVRRRFVAARDAAPGSWRYPDLRVAGAPAPGTVAVHAHRWRLEGESAVTLTLDAHPPLAGATSHRLWVLPCWVQYLGRTQLQQSSRPMLAWSAG